MRLVTYLVPGLPIELFEGVASLVESAVGVPVQLIVDEGRSGPRPGEPDPFTNGEAELGFMCAPSYAWLRTLDPPPVDLLGIGLVSRDPRAEGRPVYFSEVLVRSDSAITSLADLGEASIAFNDTASLSGYHCLRRRLDELAITPRAMIPAGSHLGSIEAVRQGKVDAAAVDANVLQTVRDAGRRLAGLRSVATLGPHPIQPMVVERHVDGASREKVVTALLRAHRDPRGRRALAAAAMAGFAAVDAAAYDAVPILTP